MHTISAEVANFRWYVEQEMAAVWATICSWFDVTDDMAGRGNKLNSSRDGLHTSGTGNPEKMLILVEATELDIRLTRNGIS